MHKVKGKIALWRLIVKLSGARLESNPQAPDLPHTVNTLSKSFENVTNVFAGAENHKRTLKSEMYLKNRQKLLIFISIFSPKYPFYGASVTLNQTSHHPHVTHCWLK